MTKRAIEQAEFLERSGRLSEAAELWRDVLRTAPTAESFARLGRLCLRQGDVEEGERLLREAIRRFPNHPDAYFYLGTHIRNSGEPEEARRLLQHCVSLDDWAPAWVALGEAHRQLNHADLARSCFERAATLEPDNSEAWLGVGLTYAGTDDARARQLFERAIELDSENNAALRELGLLRWRERDLVGAEDSLRKALRLNGNDPWAHDFLGLVLQGSGRDVEAEDEFRTAARLWPDLPLFHCHLGDALVRLGRDADGEESYRTALSLDVSNYLSNLRMGQLLKARGQRAHARVYIERALRAEPSNREAREALDSLKLDP